MVGTLKKFFLTSLGKTFIAFIDQGFLSVANFLFGILIIKSSSKEEYGLYVLAYSFIMLGVGLQNALINTQATVLVPRKKKLEDRQCFKFSLYFGQYYYWVLLSIIIITSVIVLKTFEIITSQYFSLIIATTITTLFYFLREYNRTLSFIELKPHEVLIQDIVYLLSWFSSFVLLCSVFSEFSIFLLAILSIGIASSIISMCMTYLYRSHLKASKLNTKQHLIECWKNGKWSLLGVIITWIEAQSYIYLLSFIGGIDNTASANAARQFFMPVMLLSVSYGRIFRPKWANERAIESHESIIKSAKKAVLILISLIIVYTVVIVFAAKTIIPIIYTDEYIDCVPYILIWAIYFSLNIAATNSSAILQVYEKFKTITRVSAITAAITVITTIILVNKIGGIGSVLAMCIGQFFLLILLQRCVKKEVII